MKWCGIFHIQISNYKYMIVSKIVNIALDAWVEITNYGQNKRMCS